MSSMAPQITILTIVYSAVYSGTDQRNHQSSASLAFVVTGEFPTQRASDAENVSIWWRHHGPWGKGKSMITTAPAKQSEFFSIVKTRYSYCTPRLHLTGVVQLRWYVSCECDSRNRTVTFACEEINERSFSSPLPWAVRLRLLYPLYIFSKIWWPLKRSCTHFDMFGEYLIMLLDIHRINLKKCLQAIFFNSMWTSETHWYKIYN